MILWPVLILLLHRQLKIFLSRKHQCCHGYYLGWTVPLHLLISGSNGLDSHLALFPGKKRTLYKTLWIIQGFWLSVVFSESCCEPIGDYLVPSSNWQWVAYLRWFFRTQLMLQNMLSKALLQRTIRHETTLVSWVRWQYPSVSESSEAVVDSSARL